MSGFENPHIVPVHDLHDANGNKLRTNTQK